MLGAVVFDLFGTLVEGWGERSAASHADAIAEILEVPGPAFRQVMEDTYTLRASGELGGPEEMFRNLCQMLGRQPGRDQLQRAGQARVAQFHQVLRRPRPEVPSLLAVLRDRSVRIGLLTDCSGETPIIWPRLAWAAPIEATVFSWQEGVRKPALSLYRRVAELLGVDPSQCLYVGDGGSQELSGAERAGMRTRQLVVDRGDGDGLFQYDPDTAWSGTKVATLSAILPLLGR